MLLFLGFALLAGAAFFVAEYTTFSARHRADSLQRAATFGGFVMPDVGLPAKARARREAVRAELPDALDLLAVSVEAGMGFDGAISKLAEHMDGPLTEEFNLALGEMRIGEGRQEALKKMA